MLKYFSRIIACSAIESISGVWWTYSSVAYAHTKFPRCCVSNSFTFRHEAAPAELTGRCCRNASGGSFHAAFVEFCSADCPAASETVLAIALVARPPWWLQRPHLQLVFAVLCGSNDAAAAAAAGKTVLSTHSHLDARVRMCDRPVLDAFCTPSWRARGTETAQMDSGASILGASGVVYLRATFVRFCGWSSMIVHVENCRAASPSTRPTTASRTRH
eukprot:gnl/TRDRNA2_/TRDRNA2_177483_c1_seq1.p1 gnl/TRDRNA2_/TRDRNA2_177483_c1~~gnl/TRDRNA2_/TRDRNA2_177483_c1_seq1.p1  ORF type:complete len:217 (-),score=16.54 gnl/TRDRNA2_/TRDRNA2_177483_c1_seq1:715-1365(-)